MIGAKERRAVQTLYAGVFLSMGVHAPFLAVWLVERGFSPGALGAVFSVFPLARILVPPGVGFLADAGWGGLRLLRLAVVLSLLGGVALCVAPPVVGPLFLLAFTLFAVGRAPVVSLADGMAFSAMKQADPVLFGRLRRFGSLSFLLAALLCGAAHDFVSPLAFEVGMVLGLGVGLVTALQTKPFEAKVARARWADWKILFGQRRFLVFLLVAVLAKIGESPFDIYLGVRLREAGAGWGLIALGWLLAVGPELLVFSFLGGWLEKRGLLLAMGAALVVTSLRWAVLGFSSSLWVLLLSQPLHAVSFAVYFVCAATYVARSAPAPLRHSGQALLSALVYGGGGALGSWIAGLVSVAWSVRGSFLMGAGLALVAALLMVLLGRRGESEGHA